MGGKINLALTLWVLIVNTTRGSYAMRNHSRFVTLSFLLTVMVLLECNKSINRYEDEIVLLKTGRESLVIQNKSADPLFYIVLEEEISTRVDILISCDNNNYVEGNEMKIIPYGTIMGYKTGAKILIYTWLCDETNTAYDIHDYQMKTP